MKAYVGVVLGPGAWTVQTLDRGKRRVLNPRTDVRDHSPTGFAWGYEGSGPAQLALAILCNAVGKERALPLHQDFKRAKIAPLDAEKGWSMTEAEVLAWVAEAEAAAARRA